ncbi:MAG: pirin family protein [Myxococcota bacterium]
MKLVKRPAAARGRTRFDWLDSWHTFSFGDYHDPAHMGFRDLRVINDDVVEPGRGFGTHGHANAEILTYVLEGRLAHRDSMGSASVIEAGSLQYMSAGSGVTHSEMNPSPDARVHLLQIWILPDAPGGEPRYAEKHMPSETRANALTLVYSGRPRDGATAIRADADVLLGRLDPGQRLVHRPRPGRGLWLHAVRGDIEVEGEGDAEATRLAPGDGAAIEDAASITLASRGGGEILLFDLG